MTVDIEQATALLRAGKPLDAARVCGSLLAQQPRNAFAAHVLGLALKDSGDWAQGERWLRFSIQLAPDRAEFQANLANLLRTQQKYVRAERFYRRALALQPDYPAARRGLALTLIDLGNFADAESECRLLLGADSGDVQAWILLGMALMPLQRLDEAESAYRRALQLEPENALALNNLGALLLKMNRPDAALEALDAARRAGVDGYELALTRGAAALQSDELELAESEFERAVSARPDLIDAHLDLARLRYMRGDPHFARSLTGAVAANRDNVPLQLALANVFWRAGDLDAAETLMRDALQRRGDDPEVQGALAAVLLEAGRAREAELLALRAANAAPDVASIMLTLISASLACGQFEDTEILIATQLRRAPGSQLWLALDAIAARALGRDRYHELYDYATLVQSFELPPPPGWSSAAEFHAELGSRLTQRHSLTRQPLDQSLRHGTQTPRSLLAESDPLIQALLRNFAAPIEEYCSRLRVPAAHPLHAARSQARQLVGAWSVRLARNGFHVNHIHQEGLLSSAFYVQVPQEAEDAERRSGWLKFGEPRYPVPGIAADLFIQPRPGRLVLFPSYMWHGTTAILADQSRICVAFDVQATSHSQSP